MNLIWRRVDSALSFVARIKSFESCASKTRKSSGSLGMKAFGMSSSLSIGGDLDETSVEADAGFDLLGLADETVESDWPFGLVWAIEVTVYDFSIQCNCNVPVRPNNIGRSP